MSSNLSEISHDQLAVRRKKLEDMRSQGADPFRSSFQPTHTAVSAVAAFVGGAEEENQPAVRVAGRLKFIRKMGKAQFVKIQDQTGIIQSYVRIDALGEEAYANFKKLDTGDIIGVEGTLFQTKTGEVTVRALQYEMVSKALRPLPEKFHGLTDQEQRIRQRHLDLVMNLESRERFFNRSRIISGIRRFLEERDYLEVETPVFQNVAGGAAAKPFVTHHNALDRDFVLRISLELYLKRLLVGGFDRVFEIGRNFRNEGISRRHNPEFTMLELYEAYSDYRGMMELIQSMLRYLVKDVLKKEEVKMPDGEVIDFMGAWREAKYKDLVCEKVGDLGWFDLSKETKIERAREMKLEVEADWEDYEVSNEVFGKLIEPTLIQPTFVTHLPKELCPLAKITKDDPSTIDVFELCIGGMEIAPAYSEQNDPDVQREMFEKQAGEETQSIDDDFLETLEYGMPPAGGLGMGIDRIAILLTEAENIRDVILYPQLRS
ncbi:lysine--tRNA ligase [Candidatus Pelagisphaera phototrophica]|uniref:lysine--tRNA ligase n=1 Tax=Candidatus Pelagisphaera phototrophica TaxID=2684113 RepID=UPI001A09AA99|nr:lysine--tRNA ligase [Candidatus Pelagisphaera phototrophica]QXD30618.1 lysine--tRNA ligase [Candidatus Pelagisphaera phototrophica]